jgi:putative ABC transport system substrate-binding protein
MHNTLLERFLGSLSDNRKSKTCTKPGRGIQNRKWVGIVALVITFAMYEAMAHAQQQARVARIGYLNDSPLGSFPKSRAEAFRQGLRELGYEEGKNIVIEWRYGDGKPDRVSDRAAQLVRLKVEVIVTAGSGATRSAKEATVTIPIVMTQDTDPVRNGFVASLARPGVTLRGYPDLPRS